VQTDMVLFIMYKEENGDKVYLNAK